MRHAPWLHLEPSRIEGTLYSGEVGQDYGAFVLRYPPTGVSLRCIASNDLGWEHVSVSLANRTPNWAEMEWVCRQFWTDEECVMQLHPPRADWVCNHPHVLHLWRPWSGDIPRPPSLMVGIKAMGDLSKDTSHG